MKERSACVSEEQHIPVKLSVLPHPYPYKCSFTICNDCDYSSLSSFTQIHKFLNTTESTALGTGLGLPVADSIFMFSQRPGALSYFKDLSREPGSNSSFIRDAISEGWIDTMHGYGDFITGNSFSRDLAETALSELDKHNIKFKVWTNHGSNDNSQNLSFPGTTFKTPSSLKYSYRKDLLRQYGIKFIAGSNTDLIGQDGSTQFLSKSLSQQQIPLSAIKKLYGQVVGKKLIQKTESDEQGILSYFCRARNGVLRPDARYLSFQLSEENIENLVRSEGHMILYQHLGAKDRSPTYEPFFDSDAVKRLQHISDLHKNGIIWVAPTSRILTYKFIADHITVKASVKNSVLFVDVSFDRNIIREDDLSDLSILIENNNFEKITVLLNSNDLTESSCMTLAIDDNFIIKLLDTNST